MVHRRRVVVLTIDPARRLARPARARLSTVLDGRPVRMLAACARASGFGLRTIVGAAFGLFTKAVSTIGGSQLLAEIRKRGYTGSQNLPCRYITQGRAEADRPAATMSI
jgi:hypothetical protein